VGGGYKLSGQGAKLRGWKYSKHPITVVQIPVSGDYLPLKTQGWIFSEHNPNNENRLARKLSTSKNRLQLAVIIHHIRIGFHILQIQLLFDPGWNLLLGSGYQSDFLFTLLEIIPMHTVQLLFGNNLLYGTICSFNANLVKHAVPPQVARLIEERCNEKPVRENPSKGWGEIKKGPLETR
jgi:hypothetical protein